MKPRIKQIAGAALLVVGCLWMTYAQMKIWMVPVAMASEAPDRHFPKQENFSKKEAYDLSFDLAFDIGKRIPNILLPTALLLAGSWLFFSSRHQIGAKP